MQKKDRPYSVLPYDPAWAQKYKKEKQILKKVFGDLALQIEHIGSTSIKEMWAKPQIDILVIVEVGLENVKKLTPKIKEIGYKYEDMFEDRDRGYFVKDKPSGEREFSVHVLQKDSPEAKNYLNFRDYLRAHPQAVEEYSKAKREAFESSANRVEYPKLKHETLDKILQKSKEWADK